MNRKFLLDGEDAFLPPYSIQCGGCAHLLDASRRTCTAFAQGIPAAIWLGQHDHTQPYEGDGGIRYERKPKEDGS